VRPRNRLEAVLGLALGVAVIVAMLVAQSLGYR
jgi:hypothetical protein